MTLAKPITYIYCYHFNLPRDKWRIDKLTVAALTLKSAKQEAKRCHAKPIYTGKTLASDLNGVSMGEFV